MGGNLRTKLAHRMLIGGLVLVAIGLFIIIGLKIKTLLPVEDNPGGQNSVQQPSLLANEKYILSGLARPFDPFLYQDVQKQETALSRQYDVVRVGFDSWQQVVSWSNYTAAPTDLNEYKLAAEGRLVHLSLPLPSNWTSVNFGLRSPGSDIYRQFQGFIANLKKYLDKPLLLSLEPLPESQIKEFRSQNTAQSYADMQCAAYQIIKATDNRIQLVFETKTEIYGSEEDIGGRLYPGDQCVDWIGVLAVNDYKDSTPNNWQNLIDIIKTDNSDQMLWYDWATKDWTNDTQSFNSPTRYGVVTMLDGTQQPRQAKGQKSLLVTFSSREDINDPNHKAAWLAIAKNDLASRLSEVKMIQYLDINDYANFDFSCYGSDYRVNSTLQADNLSQMYGCGSVWDSRQYLGSFDGQSFQAWKSMVSGTYFNIATAKNNQDPKSSAADIRYNYLSQPK